MQSGSSSAPLTRSLAGSSPATFANLKRHFSDAQIMEIVYVVALWRMHGMIVRALHLEYDDDTTARMQEIPAPPAHS